METTRCRFWLPRKNRFCANIPIDSVFCGNHTPRSDEIWIPCPIDSSHSVLKENLDSHVKRCPMLKQAQSLALKPYYQKGINSGDQDEESIKPLEHVEISLPPCGKPGSRSLDHMTSESKRTSVYKMTVDEYRRLVDKIKLVQDSMKRIQDSYTIPEECGKWIEREVDDGKLPFQEKHVTQQASILGNLERFGVLGGDSGGRAVVEFGAGRGYLTQMLADCYSIEKVFLVERKAYKLKADRSLRKKESLVLERLRIDIEDLNLNAVDSLQGCPYLAIGKHLCGPATDMTLRCCLVDDCKKMKMSGLAIATCCHHLCQWKNYINKKFFLNLGITKEEFHMITWFTSWAVDADHSSDLSEVTENCNLLPQSIDRDMECGENDGVGGIIRNMGLVERARFGFVCKQIIDMGRMMWLKERGLETHFVKYVPSTISPENHLLIARGIV